MVAAGVYMLCRVLFLFNSDALHVIAYIGSFTALLAALIAIQQNDIKRILAYSTLSQLGYMVMAVGLSGPTPAMFHLTTHAFFKALLFLGAGSVIIALHHEQDIWKMGGLRQKMPVTFWTFIIGTLALCGVPPFSGFYSKDSILAQALEQKNYPLFVLGAAVAGLTTFYMFRLFYVAFLGKPRTETAEHAHESPAVMSWPLIVLAVFSVIGGVIGVTNILDKYFFGLGLTQFILHGYDVLTEVNGDYFVLDPLTFLQSVIEPFTNSPFASAAGITAVILGFFAARMLYRNAATDPLPAKLGALAGWMRDRFYFDEIYEATFIRAHDFIAAVMDWIDRWLVDWTGIGLVRGGTDITGRALRLMQTGNLQTYAFLFALGVAVVLYFALGK
jgi:NADH-quinone oxidoreductase subunit L